MARRGKKEEEHENLERWLVSYADFITLLFAFFVVMYALTSANEGKYRVISESLSQAFRAGLGHSPGAGGERHRRAFGGAGAAHGGAASRPAGAQGRGRRGAA